MTFAEEISLFFTSSSLKTSPSPLSAALASSSLSLLSSILLSLSSFFSTALLSTSFASILFSCLLSTLLSICAFSGVFNIWLIIPILFSLILPFSVSGDDSLIFAEETSLFFIFSSPFTLILSVCLSSTLFSVCAFSGVFNIWLIIPILFSLILSFSVSVDDSLIFAAEMSLAFIFFSLKILLELLVPSLFSSNPSLLSSIFLSLFSFFSTNSLSPPFLPICILFIKSFTLNFFLSLSNLLFFQFLSSGFSFVFFSICDFSGIFNIWFSTTGFFSVLSVDSLNFSNITFSL